MLLTTRRWSREQYATWLRETLERALLRQVNDGAR